MQDFVMEQDGHDRRAVAPGRDVAAEEGTGRTTSPGQTRDTPNREAWELARVGNHGGRKREGTPMVQDAAADIDPGHGRIEGANCRFRFIMLLAPLAPCSRWHRNELGMESLVIPEGCRPDPPRPARCLSPSKLAGMAALQGCRFRRQIPAAARLWRRP